MNTNKIKKYAPQARREFIEAIGKRLNQFGVYVDGKVLKISEPIFSGSVMQIDGNSFDVGLSQARKRLVIRAEKLGFAPLVEHVAYTWFNRLCAIRFMELKTDYLEHGLRVLSHPEKSNSFEILDHAQDAAEALGLDRNHIVELKLAGNKDEELYRHLLLGQCHQLHQAMPFLFEALDDETELLLPDNLIRTDSILRGLVDGIPEEDWEQVEIIGWLYQFYISEKKDQVIGSVVKSEDIPAATQLFTPNWIVKYLVQNSVGRQWLMTFPDSSLKGQMAYYIEPAEQEASVKSALAAITPTSIEPESIKVIDPACGSGHISVEAYDVLKAIYEERGYRSRDIPKLILENNIFGLDIDDRAAQLAGFALMMKARADDKRIFTRDIKLNVLALQSTQDLNLPELWRKLDLNNVMEVGATESIFEEAQSNLIDVVDDVDLTALEGVLVLFEQVKTFGSLIQVPHDKADFLHDLKNQLLPLIDKGDNYKKMAATVLLPFVEQAWLLAQQYDAVVANPPYMGGKGMNAELKVFAQNFFPDSKSDLFAMFMERAFDLLKDNGYNAQVNMQSWMFLSSYQSMREKLLDTHTFITMAHLGARAFGQISGEVVQTTAFVLDKRYISYYRPTFFRLIEGNEDAKRLALLNKENSYSQTEQAEFKKIPGSPIAYWVSDTERNLYVDGKVLGSGFYPRKGMDTGENDLFLRLWWEISVLSGSFLGRIVEPKWFPYNKGGGFRRWYGNRDYLVNWNSNGSEIKSRLSWNKKKPTIRNASFYLKSGFSWSTVSSCGFSARYSPEGALFDNGGCTLFADNQDALYECGALLNNNVSKRYLEFLSPTLNFQPGDISNILYIESINKSYVIENCKQLISHSKQDWNTYETSWDFQRNPLIVSLISDSATRQDEVINVEVLGKSANPAYRLFNIYEDLQVKNCQTIAEMQRLEQENNRLFIDAYGLQDELEPDVPLEQITLTVNPKYRYGGNLSDEELAQRFQSDTLAELISYAIGCMMGRYRIDKPGLIYAHSGNIDFDKIYNNNDTNHFLPDDDGIIPLTDQEWFKDDATNRFRDFVRTVWGEENLQANLDFVAESLCLSVMKPKKAESNLETVRRYLSTQFYKDHLKTYKKRPIYWLFSSGKHKGFECLVYLHRYNEGTLSRMRTEYVTPLLGKYDAFAVQLNKQMEDATTSEVTRLKKDLIALEKKQTELRAFDDKLKHYADMRIKIDLDDGVKVNYGKFGDLLSDVKAVTGEK